MSDYVERIKSSRETLTVDVFKVLLSVVASDASSSDSDPSEAVGMPE